jgi:hypothetical protein
MAVLSPALTPNPSPEGRGEKMVKWKAYSEVMRPVLFISAGRFAFNDKFCQAKWTK